MAGALAERQGVAAPLTQEEQRSLQVVDRPGRRARRRRRLLSRPAALLVLFAVCLALLGVGRVTLTFAVVQKSLDTERLLAQQRVLRQENAQLGQRIAKLTAATRVHNLAVGKLGLRTPPNVVYLPEGTTTGSTGTLGADSTTRASAASAGSLSAAAVTSTDANGSTATADGAP